MSLFELRDISKGAKGMGMNFKMSYRIPGYYLDIGLRRPASDYSVMLLSPSSGYLYRQG